MLCGAREFLAFNRIIEFIIPYLSLIYVYISETFQTGFDFLINFEFVNACCEIEKGYFVETAVK